MTRFLRYAVDHDRKIRAVFLLDGKPVQKTVRVLAYDAAQISFQLGAKKKPLVIPAEDLLACAYARGDCGEE
ncbi:MAG: hypothetical protein RSB91_00480 [Clostridia bacterium]